MEKFFSYVIENKQLQSSSKKKKKSNHVEISSHDIFKGIP